VALLHKQASLQEIVSAGLPLSTKRNGATQRPRPWMPAGCRA